MRLARKVPIFAIVITLATGLGTFFAVLGVMSEGMERQLVKRGESTAQSFAMVAAPRLLANETHKLQYDLGALANDPDVVDAVVADHKGNIVAALASKTVGMRLHARFLRPDAPSSELDRARGRYHFVSKVRYGDVDIGTFLLSLSTEPLSLSVARAHRRALVSAFGIAVVLALLAMWLVRREVQPLAVMSTKLAEVAKGNFGVDVAEHQKDEVGELGHAFNHMQKRMRIFFHYVDKMIIDRLVADPSLTRPGGRLRNIAVVFGDMRGYTAMSNRRSADEVVRIVNTYFHLFVECIDHYGGVVDKTMGDAIMAIFEAKDEEPLEVHRQRAALALTTMKAASRILNMLLRARPEDAVRMALEAREFGFAQATGPAIVGNIGSKRRMDYTVCGRVVNLASRLEGLTKAGEVIIDNFTYFDAGHLFRVESLPPVQPKGFSEREKVVPHRVVSPVPAELARMREYLGVLFSYNFVQELLMPADLPEREQHSWCLGVHRQLQSFISESTELELFSRINTETGELIDTTTTNAGPVADADGAVLIPGADVQSVGDG